MATNFRVKTKHHNNNENKNDDDDDFKIMATNFRVKTKQKIGKKKGDLSTTIEFEYHYSSILIDRILEIDLDKIDSLRRWFPAIEPSLTIRTLPDAVMGFSTDWSVILKRIEWYCELGDTQQLTFKRIWLHTPNFEKEMYIKNKKALKEQQVLLRQAREKEKTKRPQQGYPPQQPQHQRPRTGLGGGGGGRYPQQQQQQQPMNSGGGGGTVAVTGRQRPMNSGGGGGTAAVAGRPATPPQQK